MSKSVSAAGSNSRVSWITKMEWGVFALVAVASVALHFRFALFVGALWRDEINSLNLATLPAWSDVGGFLDYDSFPILFFGVLRAWAGFFGTSDDALRLFGLIIGLAVLGALWMNARVFCARLPLLSLALLGLNPMIIRYGDSVRAYGLGIFLILLTLRSFWRLVETETAPSTKRIGIAALCALLSVQTLYYNSVLLLAIALGAIAVAARRQQGRTILIILGIGMVAALSLLPYAPMILRMREWTFLVQYPGDFAWLWRRASEVTGSPRGTGVWLWAALVLGGIFATIALALVRRKSETRPGIPAPVLFAAVTTLVGLVGYACFLRVLNYYTQPWYYITLVAFVGCNLDILFGAWPQQVLSMRMVRLLVAGAMLCFCTHAAWEQMTMRHTNVDLVAARLDKICGAGDLILVPRWEFALPLAHYYHGPSEIVTLPPMPDHRFHRYDLVLAQMKTQDAHLPVLAKMADALRNGHRVYFAGELPLPAKDVQLPVLRPFYRDEKDVPHGNDYNAVWQLSAGQFLAAHALKVGTMSLDFPGYDEVQEYETIKLGAAEGWRD